MPRRSFKSELATLVFALGSNRRITSNPDGNNIFSDCNLARQYHSIRNRRKKYLLWSLLIGRSADSFTLFFTNEKGIIRIRPRNDFNNRILRICARGRYRNQNPLTSDPTIQTDLDSVRLRRNDIFHNAGRHFNDNEMQEFVFKTVRCLQQLLLDL